MTIFFTGATGFLGRYFAATLLKQGNKILFLARSKGNISAKQRIDNILSFIYPDILQLKDHYSVVEGDVTKRNFGIPAADYERLLDSGIDEVWSVAGSISFSEKVRNDTFRTNVIGMEKMLAFCNSIRPRQLHFISTAYVCGNTQGVFKEDTLNCGQKFNNPYEESKFIAESKIREWNKANFETKIFIYRPSIVVGDSITGKTAGFSGYYTYMRTYHILKKLLEKRGNNIPRDTKGRLICPLHVPGVYEANLNIVTIDYVTDMAMRIRNRGKGGVYHLTDSNPKSYGYWLEIGTQFLGFSGITTSKDLRMQTIIDSELLQAIERQIAKGIIDYLPYFSHKQFFDKTNVKDVLGVGYYEHPPVTPALIETLLKYAVAADFKIAE
ncbi:MAG: SDR family oxidoreductase [Nitrospirae bacterium]|nr:SDR family oxidoreductase [Nitrospirota bacterium]